MIKKMGTILKNTIKSTKNTVAFIAILLIITSAKVSLSQELKCRIQVNSSQIQGTNKTIFEDLQKNMYEFLNGKNWTNHIYKVEELIECNFMLNITKQISTDEFEGTLQVTSSRPVYNSGYSSPMLNIMDKDVKFRYAEGQSLDFSESTHNELMSLFAYYIYIILGFDYDSFSLNGGSEYFQIAEKIVTAAQSSSSPGWKSFEKHNKNRYWLIENILNNVYAPIRTYNYIYHRKGLDLMAQKANEGRTEIINNLQSLMKVHRQKPSSFFMTTFFSAKNSEIVKIVQEAPSNEAMRAYNILREIDPGHISMYEKIIKNPK